MSSQYYLCCAHIIGCTVLLQSATLYSVPVRKSFSRLLFHLEAVRLPPSYLSQRRFTANFNSDDDFVKFPSSSIFPGSSLTGLEVRTLSLVSILLCDCSVLVTVVIVC